MKVATKKRVTVKEGEEERETRVIFTGRVTKDDSVDEDEDLLELESSLSRVAALSDEEEEEAKSPKVDPKTGVPELATNDKVAAFVRSMKPKPKKRVTLEHLDKTSLRTAGENKSSFVTRAGQNRYKFAQSATTKTLEPNSDFLEVPEKYKFK